MLRQAQHDRVIASFRFKHIFTTILFLVILISLSSCSKKKAINYGNTIYVLADEKVYDKHISELNKIYNDVVFTPRAENRFNLQRVSLDGFKDKNTFHNLILLTDIDNNSVESNFIKAMFSEKILAGVRTGDYIDAILEDLWAFKQNIIVFFDSKEDNLTKYLQESKKTILNKLLVKEQLELGKQLTDDYHNAKDEVYIKEKYGFDIYITHDFRIVNEGKKNTKFIRLRRFMPDRWLTIIEGTYSPEKSFQENVIYLRDKAGEEFGDKVNINPEIISFTPDTTFSQTGYLVKGIWEYAEGGGPFFCYAFIKNNSFYLIDGSVFAPGRDKYPFLDQLDFMAKSFKSN